VLLDKGYLVPAHGNTYDFYEVPRATNLETSAAAFVHDNEIGTVGGIAVPNGGKLILPEDIEIYKINNSIDKKIDRKISVQEEQKTLTKNKEKTIEDWGLYF